MFLRFLSILLVVAAIISLGACKKKEAPSASANASQMSQPTSEAGNIPEACSLLTAADASEVFGVEVELNSGKDNSCIIRPVDPKERSERGWISLTARPAVDFARKKNVMLQADRTASSVSGVGDDAYFMLGGRTLAVLKGNTELIVLSLGFKGTTDGQQAIEQLGRKAAANL